MSDALTFTSVSRTMKLEAINRTVAIISLVLPLCIALRLESVGGEVKERAAIVQEVPRAAMPDQLG
jgi:hypothetical protein